MAVRLWLDRRVDVKNPSNVAVGFDEGVGATFFDLTVLQVNFPSNRLHLLRRPSKHGHYDHSIRFIHKSCTGVIAGHRREDG